MSPAENEMRAKDGLRTRLVASRRQISADDRAVASQTIIAHLLALPEMAAPRCVAAYAAMATEPSTDDLLDRLAATGVLVLLPVLRADRDLDWAAYEPGQLAPGPAGGRLREPIGPRLGVAGIARADVVVVPALAVDRRGVRLGRGGGSYDRALVRARDDALVVALLYDGELLDAVPSAPHDQPVDVAVTPTGARRLRARA